MERAERSESAPGPSPEGALEEPRVSLPPVPEKPRSARQRLERFVVHNILHLDDTPHRIAMGVFLGFFVGATPTLGLQMILYLVLAAALSANKLSGLGPIWITNPLTAVPIYYFNWRLGSFLMTGRLEASEASKHAIGRLVSGIPGQDAPFWERLFSREFWGAALDAFARIGSELWVGSVFVGILTGGLAYWATYRAVVIYRDKHRPE